MVENKKTILFDGVCNLCNYWVDFFIRKDKKKELYFASLQSDFGQKVLADNNLPNQEFESFIFLDNGKLYQKSTAALKALQTVWPLVSICFIIPRLLRDSIYSVIAKNRYRLFGKKETCRVPTQEEKERFVQ